MATALTPGTTTSNGLVAESDFSYEPPSTQSSYDLKSAEKNFIDKLLAGQVNVDEAEAPEYQSGGDDAGDAASPDGSLDEAQADPDPSAPPQEPEVEPEDPKLARGIERLVSRELAAKQREEAATARERALDAKIAELKSLQGLKSTQELAELMDYDPLAAFKALGKDPETMIKLALAQQLGDEAPDKLKDFARQSASQREIAKMRAELAQERQARAAQEYFNTISAGAREYVTKVGDSKLPTLSVAAKADPQYVHDEIMTEIVNDARVRGAQDPHGEPMSYAEAAARVEARLAKVAALTGGVQSASKTQAGKIVPKKPNAVPPSTKPAAKPLAPWLSPTSSLEADGIREAMAAFERAEAEAKARRR